MPCAARFAILPRMDSRTDTDTDTDRIDEAVLALLWLNLSTTGTASFTVGGTLTVTGTAPAGSYTGTYSATVTYN